LEKLNPYSHSSFITCRCAQALESTITTNKVRGFSWKFVLEVKKRLHHVCLLHETHRPSFYIGKSYWHGNRGKELMNPEKCTPEYSVSNQNDKSFSYCVYRYNSCHIQFFIL